LAWIARKLLGFTRGLALRTRWLAKRLWLVMVADVLFTARRHWKRLDDKERSRAIELAKESKGLPKKNLSSKELEEARRLLEKFNYVEFGGSVANTVLPFKPFTRLVTKYLVGRDRDKRAERQTGGAERSNGGSKPRTGKKPARSSSS
jgi:hypothetical protein